ncbi:MAG: hypothetical protein JNL57_01870 [Bacteroidetes bacterium]|nr:hypothetical protein [Bacteroidota bacterium]
MSQKIKNLACLVASLFVYLEWGGGYHSWLFQAESEVLRTLWTSPSEAAHPFTLIPLLGQILLLITLFQSRPSRWLTIAGVGGLAVLILFILFVGILAANGQIVLCAVPFVLVATWALLGLRKSKTVQ